MTVRIAVDELLAYVCADTPRASAQALHDWLMESPRLAAFVDAYRDKVRKKIRVARDTEGFRDLLSELETAGWLLREPRFTLTYEPYASRKTRGPDFAVTYRTHTTWNVEVARMRMPRDPQRESQRLTEIVCGKLSQMLPAMPNLLVLVSESHRLNVSEPMQQLKAHAERQDTTLFARHGFESRADFFRFYQRLSGILVRAAWDQSPRSPPSLWLNHQAKHPLPDTVVRILVAE